MRSKLPPSKAKERDALLISLRNQGYTYDAIADELYKGGYTDWVVNRAAVYKMVKKASPHLLGNIRRRLGLERLTRRGDTPENG